MTLTKSQKLALPNLIKWYHSSSSKAVLHGPAGSGKSFLINTFLNNLNGHVNPLILADTNEAVNVIRTATNNKYTYNTVCSALGLVLSNDSEKQYLIKRSNPDLRKHNLIIVDESSQLSEEKLNYLNVLNTYILYVGHKSQLPPIETDLKIHDLCISPVFEKDYPTFNLIDPVRNVGEIYTFCSEVEELIYKRGVVPYKFKEDSAFIADYLTSQKGKENLLTNKAVFIAYTNKRVNEFSHIVRQSIFGKVAEEEQFIVNDKLIFRSVVALFKNPLRTKSLKLTNVLQTNTSCELLTTNTRATVLAVNYKDIFGIVCYELYVEVMVLGVRQTGYVYAVMDNISYEATRNKLYYLSLYDHNAKTSKKKWKNYHDFNTILGNIKHSYALTVHCSQGSTIDDVFVDDGDINKCKNPVLKKKLRYVGYSRSKNNLFRV